MGLSLISAPLLARTLGPDGRGVLAGAFVSTQILSWVAFLGLPRGLAVQNNKRSSISGVGIIAVALLGPASALLAILSADALSNGDERIAWGIRIGALVLILSGVSQIGIELVLIQGRLWPFNFVRIATLVLPSIAYIVAFVMGRLTLEVAFSITFIGNILSTLIGCAYALPAMRSSRRLPVPWNFSLRFWSTSAFDNVGGRFDQLLLAALSPAAVLGMYAVAVTCASASGGLTQALNHVTYSRFARSGTKADANAVLRQRTLFGAGLSFIVAIPVLLIVIFFGEALFGTGYHDLALVTGILIVSQFLNDQWQLRIYMDSAVEDPSALTLASAMGLAALALSSWAFYTAGDLSGTHMAICVVLFGLVRLVARALLRRKNGRAN
jgi:O-antigen/teichoic acid export membrane protein